MHGPLDEDDSINLYDVDTGLKPNKENAVIDEAPMDEPRLIEN